MQRQRSAVLLAMLMGACGDDGREVTAGNTGNTNATSVTGVPVTMTTPTTGASDETSAAATTVDPTTTTDATTGTTAPPDATTSTTADDTTAAVSDATTSPDLTTTTNTTNTTTGDPTGQPTCETKLDAIIRDFSEGHPDFEKFGGDLKGIVLPDLGPDKKPVYAAAGPTSVTSGPDAFKQWYNDVPNVNQAFPTQLELTEVMPGIYQYNNSTFFPIDGQGFGNEGNNHNFHFTTEIHTEFNYDGGEVFTFTGDDDVWAFINGKLAIDLGGVHGAESLSVDLDASAAQLGIVKGNSYAMDIFQAERHTTQSNFRIDTTIGCFIPQ